MDPSSMVDSSTRSHAYRNRSNSSNTPIPPLSPSRLRRSPPPEPPSFSSARVHPDYHHSSSSRTHHHHHNHHNHHPPSSQSSKLVLTQALQMAQSAVLLDQVNDIPAALAAYSHSVRLLADVMARVEQGAANMRAKEEERERRRQRADRPESEAERVERKRKEEKNRRREVSRMEEARRLKLIHDAYVDRIRHLQEDAENSSPAPDPSVVSTPLPPDSFTPSTGHVRSSVTTSQSSSIPTSTQSPTTPISPPSFVIPSSFLQKQDSSSSQITSLILPDAEVEHHHHGVLSHSSSPSSPQQTQLDSQHLAPHPLLNTENNSSSTSVYTIPPLIEVQPVSPTASNPAASEHDSLGLRPSPSITSSSSHRITDDDYTSDGSGEFVIPLTATEFSASDWPDEINNELGVVSDRSTTQSVPANDDSFTTTIEAPYDDNSRDNDDTLLPMHKHHQQHPPHPPTAPLSYRKESDETCRQQPLRLNQNSSPLPVDVQSSEGTFSMTQRQHSNKSISTSSETFSFHSNPAAAAATSYSSSSHTKSNENINDAVSPRSSVQSIGTKTRKSRSSSLFALNVTSSPYPSSPSAPMPIASTATAPTNSTSNNNSSANVSNPAPIRRTEVASTGLHTLISPSTAQGTISQRRKATQEDSFARHDHQDFQATVDISSPKPMPSFKPPAVVEQQQQQRNSIDDDSAVVEDERRPSLSDYERTRSASPPPSATSSTYAASSKNGIMPNGFGSSKSISTKSSFGSSGSSLSGRLRTLSQPGRRPQLSTILSDSNAIPPLPASSEHLLSKYDIDTTTLQNSRKPLLPIPSSHRLQTSSSQDSRQTLTSRDTLPPLRQINSFSGMSLKPEAETPVSATFSRMDSFGAASSASTGGVSKSSSGPGTGEIAALTTHLPPCPSDVVPIVSVDPLRRPFQLMRHIRITIQAGGYLSPNLFIPQTTWFQSGVKLPAVETKVRMIELLLSGLESVERSGALMLVVAANDSASMDVTTVGPRMGERLSRELESFEGLLDGIQTTFAKKLGFIDNVNGKRSGQGSFGSWSSKLTRSFDRMTNTKSLDTLASYVDGLSRLCLHAQVIDRHLVALLSEDAPESAYKSLSPSNRQSIETRLRRSSEFFGSVICRFVMRDVAQLCDKYAKRSAQWACE